VKALTVIQPWAQLIVEGVKDVENRSWNTKYRGRLYIHAGKSKRWPWLAPRHAQYDHRTITYGAILGAVTLLDVIRDSASRFAEKGAYHWLLADPVQFAESIPMRGRQGLWTPAPDSVPWWADDLGIDFSLAETRQVASYGTDERDGLDAYAVTADGGVGIRLPAVLAKGHYTIRLVSTIPTTLSTS